MGKPCSRRQKAGEKEKSKRRNLQRQVKGPQTEPGVRGNKKIKMERAATKKEEHP